MLFSPGVFLVCAEVAQSKDPSGRLIDAHLMDLEQGHLNLIHRRYFSPLVRLYLEVNTPRLDLLFFTGGVPIRKITV
jgi:hypothetical protein